MESAMLSTLMKAVPPPESPMFSGGIQELDFIHDRIGTTLPSDYIDFCKNYGSGFFRMRERWDWITVNNIFQEGYIDFCISKAPSNYRVWLDRNFEESKVLNRSLIPNAIFPEPGGLLGLGGDANGHFIAWITEGPPDGWKIAVLCEGGGVEVFPMSLASFVYSIVIGSLKSQYLGRVFKGAQQVYFESKRPVLR